MKEEVNDNKNVNKQITKVSKNIEKLNSSINKIIITQSINNLTILVEKIFTKY
jgi:hypothetical protein